MQTSPEFLLSFSSYKGILYLENLGGVQLKEPPCRIRVSIRVARKKFTLQQQKNRPPVFRPSKYQGIELQLNFFLSDISFYGLWHIFLRFLGT